MNMKKVLILLPLIIFICGWYFNNYVYIENRFESIFYPDMGMVQTEEDAIELCCFYFKSVYGIGLLPSQLNAKYYKNRDAWYIKIKKEEKNVDGGLSILIRKKDGKVMMHSVY